MKVKYSKRVIIKPLDVLIRCVNCDAVANTEDIKFGCARCEANESDGSYAPKNWYKVHKEGGWYKERNYD